jgi:hypothetical protein
MGEAMETKGDTSTLADGGAMELVRVPAWEAKFKLNENPDELAHLICCRDLDWRKAACGYEEPDPTIMMEANVICTMCIEAVGGLTALAEGRCPFDDQPCPDDETLKQIIKDRTS